MIKRLLHEDKSIMLDVLSSDPVLNCYIIGDLENTGFDAPFIKFYGEFSGNQLESILMIFARYGFFYTTKTSINPSWISLIQGENLDYLSGGDQSISLLVPYFSDRPYRKMQLAILEKKDMDKPRFHTCILESKKDMETLYELLAHIDEFNVKDQSKEEFVEEKMELNRFGRTYAIYDGKQIIATASTISETKTHAVINGVATKKEYRNQGLGSHLIDRIIYDYIVTLNKGLILYYDHPDAAAIYKKKGFIDVNLWSSLSLKKSL